MIVKNKKLFILISFLAASAVLVHVLFRAAETEEIRCAKKEKSATERISHGMSWFFSSLLAQFNEPEPIRIEKVPFIKDVVLEKDTACVDEDVEVFIDASNPGGLDSNLYYQVGTESGNPGVVRFSEEGRQTFNVIVKDFTGANMDTREVTLNVVECVGRPSVSFSASYSDENQEIIEFEISGREGLSGNCGYSWDFGDGKTLVTNSAFVSHDYRGRKQDRYISSFLVTVSARDSNGKTARSRQAVSIPNIHYISNQMGNPSVPVKYDRFPEHKGKSYSADVTMYNIYDDDIQFTDAVMKFNSCISGSKAIEENVGISNLIRRTGIPPQGSISETISIDESVLPESTCVVGIEFHGTLGSEKKVTATMYLDIPPTGRNVVANHQKVTSEELIRKLNRAEKLLGTGKPVTPADLERLEKEGKL